MTPDTSGASRQYEGEHITKFGILNPNTTDGSAAYAKTLGLSVAGIQIREGLTLDEVAKATKAGAQDARVVSGIDADDVEDSNKVFLKRVAEEKRREAMAIKRANPKANIPDPDELYHTIISSGGKGFRVNIKGERKNLWDTMTLRPGKEIGDYEVAVARAQGQAMAQADANDRLLAGIQGGVGGGVPREGPGKPEKTKANKKDLDAFHVKELTGKDWGLNDTVARRLVKAGFDPTNKNQVIDARYWGLNKPSVQKLIDAGHTVRNIKGMENRERAGFSDRELVRGQEAGLGTALGQSRAQERAGLFGRKRVYNADGTSVIVEPRFKVGNAGRVIRDNTTGAVKRSITARAEAREAKRLQNPLYRISKTEDILTKRRVIEITDKAENTSGARNWYYRAQLQWLKLSLVTKGWLTFVLLAGLLFVPWIGVLQWTGYGLALVAMTILKMAAFVAVNAYNVVSSVLVGALNVVGNFFVGGLEWLSTTWITKLGLDLTACNSVTGECSDRVFSYTVSHVDTKFPGWPTFSKPAKFNTEPFLDTVLRLFGIKFSIADKVRRILGGA